MVTQLSRDIDSRRKTQRCPCCAFDLFLPKKVDEDWKVRTENKVSEGQSYPCTPGEALKCIETYKMSLGIERSNVTLLVDTHGHAQLNRVPEAVYAAPDGDNPFRGLKSLTCSVEPEDWQATLDLASSSVDVLPALGVHPWYLEDLPEDWLETLENLLSQHPSAIVGEIGLCKMARFVRNHPEGKTVAMAIQRRVFKEQLILAARLRRPASVHCVNQHGVFVSVLKEIIESNKGNLDNAFPVSIAMHSFSGTAHQIQELLDLERDLSLAKPLFYFGFSHAVNVAMCTSEKSQRKGREAVMHVPADRVIAESDVHSPAELRGGTAGAIAYIAWARNIAVEEAAELTAQNGLRFLGSGII